MHRLKRRVSEAWRRRWPTPGPVHGFDVDLGTRYDDRGSSDGASAAAQTIVAGEDVIGVIGPSCSTAAVAASPLITAAGMVLIAPSNTPSTLTSDLAGHPGLDGVIGATDCDSFGGGGSQKTTVIHHLDPDDTEAGLANIVFEFAPA